jgi:hypothetical protein
VNWQTIAAVVAAGVAGVAAIIAFSQAQSAKAQARSAKTQADAAESQAASAKEQADAAKSQAEQATRQADSAKEQAEQAKRQADFAGEAVSVAKEQVALASDQLTEVQTERKDRQRAVYFTAIDKFVTAYHELVTSVENYLSRVAEAREADQRGPSFDPSRSRQANEFVRQAGDTLARADTEAKLAFVGLVASGYQVGDKPFLVRERGKELISKAWQEQTGGIRDIAVGILRTLQEISENAAAEGLWK